MKRKRDLTNRTSQVRRQRDPIPWRYCVLTAFCGLLLLGGFFVAAKLHFSAVGYAMDNANLRLRISELKDEKRKLRLAKERASSPGRIAALARNLGFSAVPRIMRAMPSSSVSISNADSFEKPRYSYASEPASSSFVAEAHSVALKKVKKSVSRSRRPEEAIVNSADRIAAILMTESVTRKR